MDVDECTYDGPHAEVSRYRGGRQVLEVVVGGEVVVLVAAVVVVVVGDGVCLLRWF